MNINLKRPSSAARRVVSALAVGGLVMFTATACFDDAPSSKDDAQRTEQNQASSGLQQLMRSQPVHSYSFSQIKQNLQEIEDAQANGTVTTSFFLHLGLPDPVFSCSSIGAPIASTTELTNPHQTERHDGQYNGGNVVIDQADPTGVYTGSSSGTYVMCVGASGQVNPVYWEGHVLTAYGPAHWDKSQHSMVIDGAAGSKFTGIKKP